MKEAFYYKKIRDDILQCNLCPRYCVIKEGGRGNCGVRINKEGKLYLMVYGKPCSIHTDPIEKKPLFHFLPGTMSYSIGTAGCNLHCLQCQNWNISQCKPEEVPSLDLLPEKAVKETIKNNCKSISYTYTEPIGTAAEYVLDIAKIAKKRGIKNVAVSNGFINPEPLKELCKYIDAANIDLKGNAEFYKKATGAKIEPVLEALRLYKKYKVWLEVTNLIIPGYNDNEKEIKKMCLWIKNNLDINTPLHFSRFFPNYKMLDIKETPQQILIKAKEIANKVGLRYVYIGNVYLDKAENTYCYNCDELLIERIGFDVLENNIKNGKCFNCKEKITGVWD